MGEFSMPPPIFDRNRLLVVFGTATGTSREVGHRIAREAYSFACGDPPAHFFAPEVLSTKYITTTFLRENWTGENCKIIFVLSTTGQGEFPEDSKALWRELCRKSGLSALPIHYVVIGLGDSSYELYNYPGKKLHRRLQQLSGIPEFDVCLCDDQHDLGYIGALNPFLEKCWEAWVPSSFRASKNSHPIARYAVVPHSNHRRGTAAESSTNKVQRRLLIRNERLTAPDHHQDTRLIEIDTVNSSITFEEGDVVQVYPENFPENVDLFFEIFPGLRNQAPFFLESDPNMKWEDIPLQLFDVCGPLPWTWEKVAKQALDLKSIPGIYVFEILRCFTTDPLLKEKFDEYCRPEGLEELYNYINRPKRTILEVLQDFPSVAAEIPTNYIFDIIPFMRPRAFSIASPPKEDHHIEILVAVVEFKTNLKKPRRGTCSYWLAHHAVLGETVAIYCEKGSLRPPSTESHVIMVGPGTGVAPFRSMIKQHASEWDKYLFFGCRNKEKDFYFGDEFELLVRNQLLKLYPAFSRDKNGQKVDYVQDVIGRQEKLIKSIMESPLPLYIYVCGSSGDMPKDVSKAFKTVLQRIGIDKPEDLLKQMLNSGQYQTETY